mgnify:CR=1 FL=1
MINIPSSWDTKYLGRKYSSKFKTVDNLLNALTKKYKKMGSMKFAKNLMINADVAVAPGLAFGKGGEGFVRIGLVENTQRIRQAAKNIKRYFST